MEWIEQNREAPDFEEQLFVVTEGPNGETAKQSKWAGLTKEEKLIKAKELQAEIRVKKLKEEAK